MQRSCQVISIEKKGPVAPVERLIIVARLVLAYRLRIPRNNTQICLYDMYIQ